MALAMLALAACGDDEHAGGDGPQGRAGEQTRTALEEMRTADTTAADGASQTGRDAHRGGERDGRGRGGHPGSDEAPSHAEFVERADRICRSAQLAIARNSGEYRRLAKAFSQHKVDRDEYSARAGAITERSGELAQRAVADLKDLPQPASRRAAIGAYLQGATSQARSLIAQGRALRAGRGKEVAQLNRRIAEVGQKTRTAARRAGFHVCGGAGN